MKHLGWLLLVVAGCVAVKKTDGEACTAPADCSSENCRGNICIGSDCRGNTACAPNFECHHTEGDPIFGIGGGDYCRLKCDAAGQCPAQWECYRSTNVCDYVGPKVTITVSNMQPTEHEVVMFSGAFDPPRSDVTWSWDFAQLGKKTGPMVEMKFPLGDTPWSVDATSPGGGEHYENGTIRACAIVGDFCTPFAGDCCGMLSCNPSTSICE